MAKKKWPFDFNGRWEMILQLDTFLSEKNPAFLQQTSLYDPSIYWTIQISLYEAGWIGLLV